MIKTESATNINRHPKQTHANVYFHLHIDCFNRKIHELWTIPKPCANTASILF